MQRKPAVLEQVRSFPYLRIESDETTSLPFALARLGVLGSSPEFGYWAQPGGLAPHDVGRKAFNKGKPPRNGYRHGQMLLEPKWGDHKALWKMRNPEWTPLLEFKDRESTPDDPRGGVVKDWESWYKWRGLGMDSPAALLMDAPLSLYWLLTDVLGIVKTRKVELIGPAKKVDIHLVGVEMELNIIPLHVSLSFSCNSDLHSLY